jgi:hypothetical protein
MTAAAGALVLLAAVGLWLVARQRSGKTTLQATREQLLTIQTLVREDLERIRRRKQEIIDQGAQEGKTPSLDRLQKGMEEAKASYSGPDRGDSAK